MLLFALIYSFTAFAADVPKVSPKQLEQLKQEKDAADSYMHVELRELGVHESADAGSRHMELENIECKPNTHKVVKCTAMAQTTGEKITIPDDETRNFLMNLHRLIKWQKLHIKPSAESFHIASMKCQADNDEDAEESSKCTLSQKTPIKLKTISAKIKKTVPKDALENEDEDRPDIDPIDTKAQ